MGGLREEYQNNVLHGNIAVSFQQFLKCQYTQICVSNLYVKIYVSKTLSN